MKDIDDLMDLIQTRSYFPAGCDDDDILQYIIPYDCDVQFDEIPERDMNIYFENVCHGFIIHTMLCSDFATNGVSESDYDIILPTIDIIIARNRKCCPSPSDICILFKRGLGRSYSRWLQAQEALHWSTPVPVGITYTFRHSNSYYLKDIKLEPVWEYELDLSKRNPFDGDHISMLMLENCRIFNTGSTNNKPWETNQNDRPNKRKKNPWDKRGKRR